MQNEENERKFQAEEAEKRRMARLMEEIEGQQSDEYDDQERRLEDERRRKRDQENA